ncbi:MAG TPA: SDR family oxidoreductase [Saprospiraceae bacterium]|nr:SDR family oxidoreductase [Saprospiraceae bacterium]
MLKDKVAYITGGSKGIGLGIAHSLLNEGLKVAVTARSEVSLKNAGKILGNKNNRLLTLVSDVRSQKDELSAVAEIIRQWGRLDVVIANAGVGHFAGIEVLNSEQWNAVIDTNLTGVFHTVKAGLPHLIQSKGYLITIASLAGTNFFKGGSAYNASKFGLVGFTQAVMLDVRDQGVKVTTIMPGSVSSNFNQRIPGDGDEWKIQPEDLGQMVVDLLKMNPRTLPSKIEVRPSMPPAK